MLEMPCTPSRATHGPFNGPARAILRASLFSALALSLVSAGPALAECTSGNAILIGQSSEQTLSFPGLTPLGNFPPNPLTGAREATIGPDGLIYVTSFDQNAVLRFTQAGAFVGTFVAPGAGGLSAPWGLAFAAGGNLLVVSSGSDQVLRYSATGAFVDVLIDSLSSDPDGAELTRGALAVNTAGEIFVGSTSGSIGVVRRYTPTGSLVTTYPTNVNGLQDLTFDAAGLLHYAATGVIGQVDTSAGALGTTASLSPGANPTGLRFGPQGLLYVVERSPNSSYSVIDPTTGAVLSQTAQSEAPKALLLPCPLSLGDFLFFDANDDGAFGAGDSAVPAGITLSLLDGSGSPVDSDPVQGGVQPAVTSTTSGGNYLFDRLLAGSYTVVVDAANFAAGGPLAGYLSSTATSPSTGSVAENNLDHGINSAAPATTGIASGTVQLAHDVEPLGEGAPSAGPGSASDDDSDLTIDFGFVRPVTPLDFDLALRKQLGSGQPTVVQDGDDVTFTISVFNQGQVDAANIVLTDTLPAGFVLSPNDANGWVSAGATASVTFGALASGASGQIDITLRVTSSAAAGGSLNFAEISSATDSGGGAVTDIDSTPDSSSGNTPGEQPPALEDDQINEDGTQPGQDEDDHDFASVSVGAAQDFDLALLKQLAPGQPPVIDLPNPGAGVDVGFTITVINQGQIDATNVTITDTPPPGFVLSPNDTNGWVAGGGLIALALPGTLPAGAQTTVSLVLEATNFASTTAESRNFAEISSATGPGGQPVTDIDSTPDALSGNTPGEQPPALEDDQVNENGTQPGQDEDDHDFAGVTVLPSQNPVVFSLGNVVWADDNNDAIQNQSEPGIAGVTLRILDGNGNPVNPAILGDAELQTTDANGHYRFLLLTEGTYMIEVLPQNFAVGAPLEGLASSSGLLEENDPNADGDQNDNGLDDLAPEVNGIRSNPIVLSEGLEPIGEVGNPGVGVLDDNSNLTVDFGFNTSGAFMYPVPGPVGWWLFAFAGLIGWVALRTLRQQ